MLVPDLLYVALAANLVKDGCCQPLLGIVHEICSFNIVVGSCLNFGLNFFQIDLHLVTQYDALYLVVLQKVNKEVHLEYEVNGVTQNFLLEGQIFVGFKYSARVAPKCPQVGDLLVCLRHFGSQVQACNTISELLVL